MVNYLVQYYIISLLYLAYGSAGCNRCLVQLTMAKLYCTFNTCYYLRFRNRGMLLRSLIHYACYPNELSHYLVKDRNELMHRKKGSIMIKTDCYLLESINESWLSMLTLTDINKSAQGDQFTFYYKCKYSPTNLEEAKYFARYILGLRPTDHPLSRTIKTRTFSALNELVVQAYVYSYHKCLFYASKMYRTGFNTRTRFHADSLMFAGHYELYQTITQKYIRTCDIQYGTALLRRLDFYEEDFGGKFYPHFDNKDKLIKGPSPMPQHNVIDLDADEYYDPELEAVLSDLRRNYPDVQICNLLDSSTVSEQWKLRNPLGNTCYSQDFGNIRFCTSSGITDMTSKYWNLACGITISKDTPYELADSVYKEVPSDNLDKRAIMYLVESITGMLLGTSYMAGSDSDSYGQSYDDTVGGLPPSGKTSTRTGLFNASGQAFVDKNVPNELNNKQMNKIKSSVIGAFKNLKSNTLDNQQLQSYIGGILKEAGLSYVNAQAKKFATQQTIDYLAKKGIKLEKLSDSVKSGVPLLQYTQESSSFTVKDDEFGDKNVDIKQKKK